MTVEPRYYVQWATVCWQVRDNSTQRAVGFHMTKAGARRHAKALNEAGGAR